MFKHLPAWSVLIGTLAIAAEPVASPPKPSSIQVVCHGKLRHGMVAVGGETTGTKITFEGLTWELNLPDEPTRKFAADHHKQPVTVVGWLRCAKGVEKPTRWIVDVERLSESAAKPEVKGEVAPKEGASLTTTGTLQMSEAAHGQVATMELEVDGITWPLELSEQPALQVKEKSVAGQPVTIKGHLVLSKEADSRKADTKSPPALRVESITPATVTPATVEKHKP